MATFKVGQRVRMVRTLRPEHKDANYLSISKANATGRIVAIPSLDGRCDCAVVMDNFPAEPRYGSYAAWFYQLEPLTDPKADEFIERIKKLKPYEEPKVYDVPNMPTVTIEGFRIPILRDVSTEGVR